jgi:hypothetical protein
MVLDTGQGFKVRPASAAVNGQVNPFFRIRNHTEYLATVIMPSAIVEPNNLYTDVSPGAVVEIPLHGGGYFTYAVVLHTPGGIVTAQGESDPVIIIDPPA